MAARDKIKALLRVGACTDAKHDFHTNNGFQDLKTDMIDIILKGLPDGAKIDFSKLDEDKLLHNLNKIFHGEETAVTKNLIKNLENLENYTGSIKIKGYQEENDYAVSVLNKGGNLNVKKMIQDKNLSTQNFRDFFGTNDINFLIDASSIRIMELIYTLKGKPININLILNRESYNDGAGKITEFDPKRTNKSDVKSKVLYDRNVLPITYPHISNKHGYQYYLYSAFDYILEPLLIEQTGPKGAIKAVLDKVSIYKDKKLVITIDNPKESNSKNVSWERFKSVFKTDPLVASASFLGKRSGDWLQALSCIDTSREYGDTTTGKIKPIDGENILITHDRVLLWYSLIMGINVLFSSLGDEESYLIYFKNKKSEVDDNNCMYVIAEIKEHRTNESGKVELLVGWEGYAASSDTWEPITQVCQVDIVKEYIERHGLSIDGEKEVPLDPIIQIANIYTDSQCNKDINNMQNINKWQRDECDKVLKEIKTTSSVNAIKLYYYLIFHIANINFHAFEYKLMVLQYIMHTKSHSNISPNTLKEIKETMSSKDDMIEKLRTIGTIKTALELFKDPLEFLTQAKEGNIVDPEKSYNNLTDEEKKQILSFMTGIEKIEGGITENDLLKNILVSFKEYINASYNKLGNTKAIFLYFNAREIVSAKEEFFDILPILQKSCTESPKFTLHNITQTLKDVAYKLFCSKARQRGGSRKRERPTNVYNTNNNSNNSNTYKKHKVYTNTDSDDIKKFLMSNYLREFHSWVSEIDFESDPDTSYYEDHAALLNGLFQQCTNLDDILHVIYTYLPEKSFLARQIALHSLGIDSADEDFFFQYYPATLILVDNLKPLGTKNDILQWCFRYIITNTMKGKENIKVNKLSANNKKRIGNVTYKHNTIKKYRVPSKYGLGKTFKHRSPFSPIGFKAKPIPA